MVFQDYELIPTKRVNRQRATKNIYLNRLFLAGGGWSSTYFGTVVAYSWILYLRQFGGMHYSNGVKMLLGAPLFAVGFLGGVGVFGNTSEFYHLIRHANTYRKEFRAFKEDLYYS